MAQHDTSEEVFDDFIREPDPDADRPYEGETEFVLVHTYGQGYSHYAQNITRDLNSDVAENHAENLILLATTQSVLVSLPPKSPKPKNKKTTLCIG